MDILVNKMKNSMTDMICHIQLNTIHEKNDSFVISDTSHNLSLCYNKIFRIKKSNKIKYLRFINIYIDVELFNFDGNMENVIDIYFASLFYFNGKITDVDFFRLDKFPNLKMLKITYITYLNKINGLKCLKNLKELTITNCAIKKIEGLENMNNLTILNLSYNNIKKIEGLENLNNLTHLNLPHNNIKKIEGLENLNNLEHLILSYNNIKKIEGLENLNNLTYLNLSYNNIKKIEGLENLNNLTHLNLSCNNIIKIEGLENLNDLTCLELSNNQINKIKISDKNAKLKYVNLIKNKLKHFDCQCSKMNIYLQEIKLSGNNLRKIKGLNKIMNLEKIVIDDDYFDIIDIDLLKKIINNENNYLIIKKMMCELNKMFELLYLSDN
jgi:Leucine-rich repeat (LRR) protein